MATKYCDHGAYGAYAATPTWGVPQDGDGSAAAASTSAATASIVFTGTPSGSISVCGVSVSPTWGSGADAAANGLATAINAATGNVTTTGFRVGAVQLRNAVFARGPAGGAPSGTCQIMTRHGSATFNGQTAIAHTLTNVDAGASSLTFSGGAGGCWGWLFNPTATIWASAVSTGGYGLWAAALPYAGSVDAGDVIRIRSGAGASTDKVIALTANSNLTVTMSAMGAQQAPVVFVFDDGTTWTADTGNPKLKITHSVNGNQSFSLIPVSTTYACFKSKRTAGAANFTVESTATVSNVTLPTIVIGGGGYPVCFESCDFIGIGSSTNFSGPRVTMAGMGTPLTKTVFYDCRLVWSTHGNASGTSQAYVSNAANTNMSAEFYGCEFAQTAPTVAQVAVFALFNAAGADSYLFDNCTFSGFVSGSALHAAGGWQPAKAAVFRNCKFGGITKVCATGVVMGGTAANMPRLGHTGMFASSAFGKREFFADTPHGLYEWWGDRSFPTLNARLLDGVTPWSIHVVPTTVAANISRVAPFELPRISKINTLSDVGQSYNTITVEVLVEKNLSLTAADLWAVIDYLDADGVTQKQVTTFDPLGGALTASTADWQVGGSSAVVNDGGTNRVYWPGDATHFNRYKFSINTPTVIDSGSEVLVYVRCGVSVSNVTRSLFVDPDVVLTVTA